MRLLMLVLCVGLAYSASLNADDNAIPDMSMEMSFDDEDIVPFGFQLTKPAYNKDPCCAPATWEGFISEKVEYMIKGTGESEAEDSDEDRHHHHGRGGRMAIGGKISVDSTNKRVAMEIGVMKKPRPVNMTIIADYGKHVMYIADMTKKTCKKADLPGDMQKQCIPANATYYGDVRYGAGDKNSMTVDMWGAKVEVKGKMMVEMFVMVTPDLCVPFWEKGIGYGRGFASKFEVSFVNMNTKIADPAVFTPPSICTQAEDISAILAMENQYVASLLKRFSQ